MTNSEEKNVTYKEIMFIVIKTIVQLHFFPYNTRLFTKWKDAYYIERDKSTTLKKQSNMIRVKHKSKISICQKKAYYTNTSRVSVCKLSGPGSWLRTPVLIRIPLVSARRWRTAMKWLHYDCNGSPASLHDKREWGDTWRRSKSIPDWILCRVLIAI